MANVVSLSQWRVRRLPAPASALPDPEPVTFFFALDCPLSYVAAERVEREFGDVAWVPMLGAVTVIGPGGHERRAHERLVLARRAAAMRRLPLVEPERYPCEPLPATRAATYATAVGCGRSFALAALRMAFCGGYDLGDMDVIAAAAEAAGLDSVAVVAAARDQSAFEPHSVGSAPMVQVGEEWFHGEDAVARAARATRGVSPGVADGSPGA